MGANGVMAQLAITTGMLFRDRDLFVHGVRRNVAGLLVGAIDTTATAVAKIIRMASTDDAVLARVERAVDDSPRMIGWCNELLRLWTHNPVLLRRAAVDVSVGGKNIPAGTTVVAYTQAAMFDPLTAATMVGAAR